MIMYDYDFTLTGVALVGFALMLDWILIGIKKIILQKMET